MLDIFSMPRILCSNARPESEEQVQHIEFKQQYEDKFMNTKVISEKTTDPGPALGFTDDLEKAALEGVHLCPDGGLRVRINDNRFVIEDPVPTGRQLLQAAGLTPVERYVLLLRLPDGDLESIRLDETVELRQRGVERFFAFETDRIFLFELDDRRLEWGAPKITGRTLLRLADRNPRQFGVWRIVKGGKDIRIGKREFADLSDAGLEGFRTAYVLCIEGRELPWNQPTITREQLAELGGWPIELGVVEVDPEGNERTLAPGEVVELKDNRRFGKKFRWKRG